MVMAPEPPRTPTPPPPPKPGVTKHVIRSLSRQGDTVLAEWNPTDTQEVEDAKRSFDELMNVKGYRMFVASDPTVKPELVRSFTNAAPEILAVPQFVGG